MRLDEDPLSTSVPFVSKDCGGQLIYKISNEEKISLVSHMRVHTKEKFSTCNICNKHFSSKSYLVIHMRVHTKEKPFACNICKKTFAQKNAQVSHMTAHTKEKL
ncbi:gastrula zinc finger protein XlCGF8.2DB-like [Penaeus japonicus]|uniref:gastrula zinc finger protein XlCGF8.2DB-like n=1 Tax=Penaeus japonicus TaxID=27405 RepID=UPI001C70F95C|nr:gastrula zinc finger protein XlCGF8.2DB-like [Penaeus japonicus]